MYLLCSKWQKIKKVINNSNCIDIRRIICPFDKSIGLWIVCWKSKILAFSYICDEIFLFLETSSLKWDLAHCIQILQFSFVVRHNYSYEFTTIKKSLTEKMSCVRSTEALVCGFSCWFFQDIRHKICSLIWTIKYNWFYVILIDISNIFDSLLFCDD